jgi:DNA invertase Pin-like site-specific DNA recombinase
VTKPDKLARNAAELLAMEADLSKRGIGLVVLSMGGVRLDTRNPSSKLMLTILGGVATWEREVILERQREGIAKAKAEGKYKGRPVSIYATEIARLSETMGPAGIAKQLGIARSSVYRVAEKSKEMTPEESRQEAVRGMKEYLAGGTGGTLFVSKPKPVSNKTGYSDGAKATFEAMKRR